MQCPVHPFTEVTENIGLFSQYISLQRDLFKPVCVSSHLLLIYLPEPTQIKTESVWSHGKQELRLFVGEFLSSGERAILQEAAYQETYLWYFSCFPACHGVWKSNNTLK